MTTIDNKLPQSLFPVTTSSLLKLVHHTMHGGETWCACVFQRFHDNHEKNGLMHFFPITTSSLLKLANHSGENLYASVSQRFHDELQPQALYMSSSLRHSISIHTIGIFIGTCPPLNGLH